MWFLLSWLGYNTFWDFFVSPINLPSWKQPWTVLHSNIADERTFNHSWQSRGIYQSNPTIPFIVERNEKLIYKITLTLQLQLSILLRHPDPELLISSILPLWSFLIPPSPESSPPETPSYLTLTTAYIFLKISVCCSRYSLSIFFLMYLFSCTGS